MDDLTWLGNIIISVPVTRQKDIPYTSEVSVCSFAEPNITVSILQGELEILTCHIEVLNYMDFSRTVIITVFCTIETNLVLYIQSCANYEDTLLILEKAIEFYIPQ